MQAKELFEKLDPDHVSDTMDSYYYKRIFDVMIDNDFLRPTETGELQIVNEEAYEEFMRMCQTITEQRYMKTVYSELTAAFTKTASIISQLTHQENPLEKLGKAVTLADKIKESIETAKAAKDISSDIYINTIGFMQKNAEYCLRFDNTLRPHHIREPLSKYQKDMAYSVGKGIADMCKFIFLDMGAMAIRDKLLLTDPSKDKWMVTRTLHKMGNFVKEKIKAEEKVNKLDQFISHEHPMSVAESRLREINLDTTMTDIEKGIQSALALKDLECTRAGKSSIVTSWGKRTGIFKKTDKLCHMTKDTHTAMLAALVLGLKVKEPESYEGVTFEIPEKNEVEKLIAGIKDQDTEKVLEDMAIKVHENRKAEANMHREMLGLAPLSVRVDYTEYKQKGDASMDVRIETIKRYEYDTKNVMDKLDKGYHVRIDINDGFFAVLKKDRGEDYDKGFSAQLVKFNHGLKDGYNKYSAERLKGMKINPPEMTFVKDIVFSEKDLDSCIEDFDSIRVVHDLGPARKERDLLLTAVQSCGNELHILHDSIYINGHDYTQSFKSDNATEILRGIAIKESICRSDNLMYLGTVLENTEESQLKTIVEDVMSKIKDISNIQPAFDYQAFYKEIEQNIQELDKTLLPFHDELVSIKPENIEEKIAYYKEKFPVKDIASEIEK